MNGPSPFRNAAGRRVVLDVYEEILRRWPLPFERLRLPTTAGVTAVLAFGPGEEEGPAGRAREDLILLHGAGSNSSMWVGEAAELARHRRVFAVDLPGEPGMSEERLLPWEPKLCGGWLRELVSALGLGRHSVLGVSIGGWIGLGYAAFGAGGEVPGLETLGLVSPSGLGPVRGSFMPRALLAMAGGKRGLEALSRALYGDFPPPEEAIRIGTLLARSTRPRLESPRLYSDEELRRIRARLALAVGTRDVLLQSEESAARLRRLQSGARILVIEGGGHVLIGRGALLLDPEPARPGRGASAASAP